MSTPTKSTAPHLVVAALTPGLKRPAAALARALALPVGAVDEASADFILALYPVPEAPGYRLELRQTGRGAPGPVFAEFVHGAVGHRRRFGGGRGQPLARAVGLKAGVAPSVIDATAGLGRDAFVLASLGCRVQLIERSPLVAALLENGLARAGADAEVGPIAARMSLLTGDARRLLEELPARQRPDAVYLDPMYPERGKTALVKKEMRAFRTLVGADEDADQLLAAALGCARKRVVVKRPRKAPPLAGPKPSMAIESENTRFDVYVRQPVQS